MRGLTLSGNVTDNKINDLARLYRACNWRIYPGLSFLLCQRARAQMAFVSPKATGFYFFLTRRAEG